MTVQSASPLRGGYLLAILMLLLLRQLAWSYTSPLYQAPDEVAHLQMAAQLDRHGLDFYRIERPIAWNNFEASTDFRDDYYTQKGLIWQLDRRQLFNPGSRFAPGESERLHVPVSREPFREWTGFITYGYPPLYYYAIGKVAGLVRAAGGSLIDYQFAMRAAQAALCTIFYFLIALVIRRAIPDEPMQVLAFIAVTFHPLTSFLGSIVNNDNGLLPCLALVTLGCVDVLKNRAVGRGIVLMAAGSVLMACTKPTGQLYGVACAATLMVLLLRQARFRDAAWVTLPLVLSFATESAVRLLTGDYALSGAPETQSVARLFKIMVDLIAWNMTKNIFGQFAWFEVNYADWAYYLFLGLLMIAAVPLSIVALRALRAPASDSSGMSAAFFFGAGLAIVIGAFITQYMLMPKVGIVIQGRYILPAIHFGFLALGAASCVSAAFLRYFSFGVLLLLAIVCVAGSIAAFPMIIERFYLEAGVGKLELLNRLAQYKPWYAKYNAFWYGAALVVLVSHALACLMILRSCIAVVRTRTQQRLATRTAT